MSRYAAFAGQTISDRQATHERLAATKREALDGRREIAASYVAANPSDVVIPRQRAVAVVPDLIDQTKAAREEALELAAGQKAEVDNGALEFPVLAHQFAATGPVLALGTEPLLMSPIVEYFGLMPILFNVFVTRAHTTELLRNTAHLFHLDPEDVTSFKIFLHLTDVDADCGPLHVLPADATRRVFESVDYKGVDRLDDDHVAALVGWDSVVAVTGPAGTVALADTTRCLHFGGRPRQPGKPLREMVVYHYLLPTSLLLNGDQAVSARRFLPQLVETGERAWDALIGATLT